MLCISRWLILRLETSSPVLIQWNVGSGGQLQRLLDIASSPCRPIPEGEIIVMSLLNDRGLIPVSGNQQQQKAHPSEGIVEVN